MLRHAIAAHPLLSLEALADAAARLPCNHVERRVSDAGKGGHFAMHDDDSADIATFVTQAGTSDSWVMLRFVEQLADYRALFDALVAELAPVIGAATGPALDVRGFVFISAPGTLTPFHFDAEYNILFQLAGGKSFATYPPAPPFLRLDQREAYHATGMNMLGWRDGFDHAATVHRLAPGDALFVPYASPHWVRAGDLPSISLSLTWQSGWTRAAADALALNPVLRRIGLPARDLPDWPRQPRVRALGGRIARRAGIV